MPSGHPRAWPARQGVNRRNSGFSARHSSAPFKPRKRFGISKHGNASTRAGMRRHARLSRNARSAAESHDPGISINKLSGVTGKRFGAFAATFRQSAKSASPCSSRYSSYARTSARSFFPFGGRRELAALERRVVDTAEPEFAKRRPQCLGDARLLGELAEVAGQ